MRWSLGALVLVAACSGSSTGGGGPGGAGSGGAAGEGGAAAGAAGQAGSAGAAVMLCPSAHPVDGMMCPEDGLECTYGKKTSPACRDVARCTAATWDAPESPCPPNGMGCPPTPPSDGVPCSDLSALCSYQEGTICACHDCPPRPPCTDPKNVWYCDAAGSGDCPATVPNAGTECALPSSEDCVYGSCATVGPVRATCERGLWVWTREPCPA